MPKPSGGYVPNGRMVQLLAALESEPDRIFTGYEAATIIQGDVRQVSSFVFYAERAGRLYKRVVGSGNNRRLLLSAKPLPAYVKPEPVKPSQDQARQGWKEDKATPGTNGWLTDPADPRIGKIVPDWKPPVMRHVRGGA